MVAKYLTPDNKLLNSSTEDIRVIDEQISEICEYNLRMESELNRIKSDYLQLEQQIDNFEKVRFGQLVTVLLTCVTPQENKKLVGATDHLNQYYNNLKNNLLDLLSTIQFPDSIEEQPNQENFEQFLDKLQIICNESYKNENRILFSSIRHVLKNFSVNV